MTKTDTWLSIIPELPLARAVPLRRVSGKPSNGTGGSKGVVSRIVPGYGGPGYGNVPETVRIADYSTGTATPSDWRVDLEDSQGLIYAIGLLIRQPWSPWMSQHIDTLHGLIGMWSTGDVGDVSRVLVAQLLAEVFGE